MKKRTSIIAIGRACLCEWLFHWAMKVCPPDYLSSFDEALDRAMRQGLPKREPLPPIRQQLAPDLSIEIRESDGSLEITVLRHDVAEAKPPPDIVGVTRH